MTTLSVIILLLPILLSLIPFVSGSWRDIVQSGDNALLEIATRDVPHGVFTGAYSRFGFHHPGPVYFLIRYPLYTLTGGYAQSFYIMALFIVGLSLLAAFVIIQNSDSEIAALLFAAVISFFVYSLDISIWLSQWNPFIIIFPLFLAVIGMASYSSGTVKYLPLTVLSASFAAQTHLGVVPFVIFLFLYGTVLLFHRREFSNRYVVISVVSAVILWIPVLVDQISPDGSGNLSLIYNTLSEYPAGGISRVTFASWFSSVVPLEMAVLGHWCRTQSISIVFIHAVIATLRTVLLFISLVVARRRNRHSFETGLCVLVLALIVISLLSVFSIRGDIHQYLTVWISVVSPLSWFSILLVFSKSAVFKRIRIVSVAAISILVFFTFLNLRTVFVNGLSDDPLEYHNVELEFLAHKLMDEDIPENIQQIKVSIDSSELWPEMMGLACFLEKHGYEVAVQDDYAYMYGDGPYFFNLWVILTTDHQYNINYAAQRTQD